MPTAMKTLGLLSLLLLAAIPCFTQSEKPTPQAAEPKKAFPANFAGSDPLLVYQLVDKHKNSFRKGKFESTKAFQQRIDKLLPRIKIGPGLTAVDTVTFVSGDLSESYDADSEKFEFRISVADSGLVGKYDDSKSAYFSTNNVTNKDGNSDAAVEPDPLEELSKLTPFSISVRRVTLRLRDGSRLHGTRLGQNAFGVKRKYKIKSYSSLNLILVDDDLSRLTRKFELSASPKQARLMSGKVGVAVTGKLRFPIVGSDQSYDEATITEPEESHYFNYNLYLVPDTVAIFNVKTGEIYETVSFPEQRRSVQGETWQTISNRTAVSVSDLMAANPGMKEPRGNVFVPVTGNNVAATNSGNVRVVKAQAGDTVAKLAIRHNADPIEVAKYNGLLPNSVLGAGREIKIKASSDSLTGDTAAITRSPGSSDVPKQVSGGVLNGKATSFPKPPYPPAARAVRASGSVSVQVLVDEEGSVISASAVSGHPLLRAAAVQAARSAKFAPTILSGQPVKVSGVLTYNFVP